MTPLLSVSPISERPVQIDRRFVELHLKNARGTILPDELAELEMMEAMKIEEADHER